ncbi:hypothetical protein DKM19_34505 [Streptosporangium sp. 'caverna']|nr:hypothetical protein DKM19_34505 [Streptosporangium sp. 'caverna']
MAAEPAQGHRPVDVELGHLDGGEMGFGGRGEGQGLLGVAELRADVDQRQLCLGGPVRQIRGDRDAHGPVQVLLGQRQVAQFACGQRQSPVRHRHGLTVRAGRRHGAEHVAGECPGLRRVAGGEAHRMLGGRDRVVGSHSGAVYGRIRVQLVATGA